MKNPSPILKVLAIRTHCISGISKNIEVTIAQRYWPSLESWWIEILSGAVTGYESMEVRNLKGRTKDGWSACAGTKGRWDTLFLPPQSMQRIYDWSLETKEYREIAVG